VVKKLKTWDQMPSESKLLEAEPVMNRILELKSVVRKELNDVQLIAFFMQRRVQPLQARI
jgi:hypothetical protein